MRQFAVVDVETSGLSPAAGRIVEIGLLLIDEEGNILDRYESLINPDGPVGATYIHGITGAMVRRAPRFRDVMGDIIQFFSDAVLVAHNVPFDKGFLLSEFSREGIIPGDIASLCTLQLSRKFYSHVPSRSLSSMCSYLGIDTGQAHTALDDCRAAASLLQVLRRRIMEQGADLDRYIRGGGIPTWPDIPPSGKSLRRTKS